MAQKPNEPTRIDDDLRDLPESIRKADPPLEIRDLKGIRKSLKERAMRLGVQASALKDQIAELTRIESLIRSSASTASSDVENFRGAHQEFAAAVQAFIDKYNQVKDQTTALETPDTDVPAAVPPPDARESIMEAERTIDSFASGQFYFYKKSRTPQPCVVKSVNTEAGTIILEDYINGGDFPPFSALIWKKTEKLNGPHSEEDIQKIVDPQDLEKRKKRLAPKLTSDSSADSTASNPLKELEGRADFLVFKDVQKLGDFIHGVLTDSQVPGRKAARIKGWLKNEKNREIAEQLREKNYAMKQARNAKDFIIDALGCLDLEGTDHKTAWVIQQGDAKNLLLKMSHTANLTDPLVTKCRKWLQDFIQADYGSPSSNQLAKDNIVGNGQNSIVIESASTDKKEVGEIIKDYLQVLYHRQDVLHAHDGTFDVRPAVCEGDESLKYVRNLKADKIVAILFPKENIPESLTTAGVTLDQLKAVLPDWLENLPIQKIRIPTSTAFTFGLPNNGEPKRVILGRGSDLVVRQEVVLEPLNGATIRVEGAERSKIRFRIKSITPKSDKIFLVEFTEPVGRDTSCLISLEKQSASARTPKPDTGSASASLDQENEETKRKKKITEWCDKNIYQEYRLTRDEIDPKKIYALFKKTKSSRPEKEEFDIEQFISQRLPRLDTVFGVPKAELPDHIRTWYAQAVADEDKILTSTKYREKKEQEGIENRRKLAQTLSAEKRTAASVWLTDNILKNESGVIVMYYDAASNTVHRTAKNGDDIVFDIHGQAHWIERRKNLEKIPKGVTKEEIAAMVSDWFDSIKDTLPERQNTADSPDTEVLDNEKQTTISEWCNSALRARLQFNIDDHNTFSFVTPQSGKPDKKDEFNIEDFITKKLSKFNSRPIGEDGITEADLAIGVRAWFETLKMKEPETKKLPPSRKAVDLTDEFGSVLDLAEARARVPASPSIDTSESSVETETESEESEQKRVKELFADGVRFLVHAVSPGQEIESKKVDFENNATVADRLENADVLVVGDAHGSAWKILQTLITGGRVTMPETSARKFAELYEQAIKICENEDGTRDFIPYINKDPKTKTLYGIISQMKTEIQTLEWKASAKPVVFIGDLISDRGLSDSLTIAIFNRLKTSAGDNVRILASNHDLNFIVEEFQKSIAEESRAFLPFDQSASSLRVPEGRDSTEFRQMLCDYYKNIDLFLYNQETNTFFSHAPVDKKLIKKLATRIGLSVPVIGADIPNFVAKANQWFQESIITKFANRENISAEDALLCLDGENGLIWNRSGYENSDELPFGTEPVTYVHGHDSESETQSPYSVDNPKRDRSSSNPRVVNLDNKYRRGVKNDKPRNSSSLGVSPIFTLSQLKESPFIARPPDLLRGIHPLEPTTSDTELEEDRDIFEDEPEPVIVSASEPKVVAPDIISEPVVPDAEPVISDWSPIIRSFNKGEKKIILQDGTEVIFDIPGFPIFRGFRSEAEKFNAFTFEESELYKGYKYGIEIYYDGSGKPTGYYQYEWKYNDGALRREDGVITNSIDESFGTTRNLKKVLGEFVAYTKLRIAARVATSRPISTVDASAPAPRVELSSILTPDLTPEPLIELDPPDPDPEPVVDPDTDIDPHATTIIPRTPDHSHDTSAPEKSAVIDISSADIMAACGPHLAGYYIDFIDIIENEDGQTTKITVLREKLKTLFDNIGSVSMAAKNAIYNVLHKQGYADENNLRKFTDLWKTQLSDKIFDSMGALVEQNFGRQMQFTSREKINASAGKVAKQALAMAGFVGGATLLGKLTGATKTVGSMAGGIAGALARRFLSTKAEQPEAEENSTASPESTPDTEVATETNKGNWITRSFKKITGIASAGAEKLNRAIKNLGVEGEAENRERIRKEKKIAFVRELKEVQEHFDDHGDNRTVRSMAAWISQALRRVTAESNLEAGQDPNLYCLEKEAAAQLAEEYAEDGDKGQERQAQLTQLVAGLNEGLEKSNQIDLATHEGAYKNNNSMVDTVRQLQSGVLWANDETKLFGIRKDQLGLGIAVGVGAAIGFALGEAPGDTRNVLLATGFGATGYLYGQQKDLEARRDGFKKHLEKLYEVTVSKLDQAEISFAIARRQLDTVPLPKEIKELALHIRELAIGLDNNIFEEHLAAEVRDVVHRARKLYLLAGLELEQVDIKKTAESQIEKLTGKKIGWRKFVYGAGGAIGGLLLGKVIEAYRNLMGFGQPTESFKTTEDNTAVANHEAVAPTVVVAPALEALEPASPEVPVESGPAPIQNIFSEALTAGKGHTSTLAMLDDARGMETQGLSDDLSAKWEALTKSPGKFHTWEMQQLKDLGYVYKDGQWGHPFTVLTGAKLNISWDEAANNGQGGFKAEYEKHDLGFSEAQKRGGVHFRDSGAGKNTASPNVEASAKAERVLPTGTKEMSPADKSAFLTQYKSQFQGLSTTEQTSGNTSPDTQKIQIDPTKNHFELYPNDVVGEQTPIVPRGVPITGVEFFNNGTLAMSFDGSNKSVLLEPVLSGSNEVIKFMPVSAAREALPSVTNTAPNSSVNLGYSGRVASAGGGGVARMAFYESYKNSANAPATNATRVESGGGKADTVEAPKAVENKPEVPKAGEVKSGASGADKAVKPEVVSDKKIVGGASAETEPVDDRSRAEASSKTDKILTNEQIGKAIAGFERQIRVNFIDDIQGSGTNIQRLWKDVQDGLVTLAATDNNLKTILSIPDEIDRAAAIMGYIENSPRFTPDQKLLLTPFEGNEETTREILVEAKGNTGLERTSALVAPDDTGRGVKVFYKGNEYFFTVDTGTIGYNRQGLVVVHQPGAEDLLLGLHIEENTKPTLKFLQIKNT